jgi:NAD(P)-dependent dehydrogenase (short-subunit alcohol dehydrogenase family)
MTAGPGRLEGKGVLVTGGASGIGRAVVERFASEGATVAVLDRAAEALADLRRQLGDAILPVSGDVRDATANEEAVRLMLDTHGSLDVLVANAGVFDGFVRLRDLDPELLRIAALELFETNVVGYLLAVRAALEPLTQSSGSIILTVSNAGFWAGGGGALYTASKHAIVGLIRQLAYELAPEIRVNGVAPGGTLTDLGVTTPLRGVAQTRSGDESAQAIRGRNALQIVMEPTDHVEAYVLLASEGGRAMTGSIIRVDGGVGLVEQGSAVTVSSAHGGSA